MSFEVFLVTGRTAVVNRQIFVLLAFVEMLNEKYLTSEERIQIVTS